MILCCLKRWHILLNQHISLAMELGKYVWLSHFFSIIMDESFILNLIEHSFALIMQL